MCKQLSVHAVAANDSTEMMRRKEKAGKVRLELFRQDRGGRGKGGLETESRGQGECYFLGGDHSSQ